MTRMDRSMHRLTLALAFLAVCMWVGACLEATQTTNPSSVDVQVETPAGSTGVGTTPPTTPAPPAGECRLVLEPPSPISITVGKNANVKVITIAEQGGEIPTENISVNVADPTIASLVQIDGRFVQLGGNAVGQTTAVISTACGQTAIIINVVPAA